MEIISAKNKSLSKDDKHIKNKEGLKPCTIAVRINSTLYDTLANYLSAMHNVSDYRFGSISDILRHILFKMEEDGFPHEVLSDEGAEYKDSAIKVTLEQKLFWQSLPARNRRKILEKGIIAFTKGRLEHIKH